MKTSGIDFETLLKKAAERYQWNVYPQDNTPKSSDFRDIIIYREIPARQLNTNATLIYPYYSNKDIRRINNNFIMINIRNTTIEEPIDKINRENSLIKSFLDSEPGEKHKRILFIINRTVNPAGYIEIRPLYEKRPVHSGILFAENIALFNVRKLEDILYYHSKHSSAKIMISNNSSLAAMKQYMHRSEDLTNFLFERAFMINHKL